MPRVARCHATRKLNNSASETTAARPVSDAVFIHTTFLILKLLR